MTADLDKLDALAAADVEVVHNLRLLHEPPEHHNRYPACPECALLRRYDATIRDLVAAARERDELREALEVAGYRFDSIGHHLKPDATDEDREQVAIDWWFGSEEVRAALRLRQAGAGRGTVDTA